MPMPMVSSQVIESIRTQSMRHVDNKSLYCMDVLKEIKEENPHLAEAIRDTITLMCKECEINMDDPRGFYLMLNVANLAVSVYQSIKQQIICDELEDV
jgi:hypothetical protein